ncbi:MAG: hypothetical protein ACFFC6_11850 [Promethearchaeota archaeon]
MIESNTSSHTIGNSGIQFLLLNTMGDKINDRIMTIIAGSH